MPKHHYKEYDQPRIGLFRVEKHPAEYDLKNGGWVTVEEKILIIGEDDHNYVEEIIHSSVGIWRGDKVINCKYTIRVGPHKSRLIRWLPNQLQLF
jgi:hypothetical protein